MERKALDDDALIAMSAEHDLCVIATDGVAPKAYLARVLYPLVPTVQAAMNATGSVAMIRTSSIDHWMYYVSKRRRTCGNR